MQFNIIFIVVSEEICASNFVADAEEKRVYTKCL
jgi:hypothetical protein